MNEYQLEKFHDDLQRIGSYLGELGRICDTLCNCVSGLNFMLSQQKDAMDAQTNAIQELGMQVAQPLTTMQADIAEIKAGVNEMR